MNVWLAEIVNTLSIVHCQLSTVNCPLMKNLWLFLAKYNAVFWFVLFFALSVVLVVRHNNFQRASFIHSSNVLVGSLYKRINVWREYLALDETNELLAGENALLRQRLQNLLSATDSAAGTLPLAGSDDPGRYEFIVAGVANNSIHQKSNYLTLDKGTLHGVEKDMGVIASNGVVGLVVNVSPRFSTVQSLLHPGTKISVTLDETGAFGSLVWGDNTDPRYAMVRDVPNHVQAQKGAKVYTSGYSLFPQGILVGEVVEAGIASGESFLDLRIKLSTDFGNLHHVYIVKDLMLREKQALEATNRDNG